MSDVGERPRAINSDGCSSVSVPSVDRQTQSRTRRRWCLFAGCVALCVLFAGCFQPIGPARSFDSYEAKAKDTAETALSGVETARLTVQTAKGDDAFPSYVAVTLSDAEGEAGNAHTTFDKVQPPNKKADDLRDQLDQLLVRADDAISSARIAARRADFDEVAKQSGPLARSARELKAFVEAHS